MIVHGLKKIVLNFLLENKIKLPLMYFINQKGHFERHLHFNIYLKDSFVNNLIQWIDDGYLYTSYDSK